MTAIADRSVLAVIRRRLRDIRIRRRNRKRYGFALHGVTTIKSAEGVRHYNGSEEQS